MQRFNFVWLHTQTARVERQRLAAGSRAALGTAAGGSEGDYSTYQRAFTPDAGRGEGSALTASSWRGDAGETRDIYIVYICGGPGQAGNSGLLGVSHLSPRDDASLFPGWEPGSAQQTASGGY